MSPRFLPESPFNTKRLSADVTNSTVTAVDISALAVPLAANGVVAFAFILIVDAGATTTGIHLAINGPATPTAVTMRMEVALTTTTQFFHNVNAYETYPTAAQVGTSPGTTRSVARVTGVIRNGATAGNLVPRIRSEVAASAVTARIGSYVSWR